MATIDYKQKIKDYMNSSEVDTLYKSMLNNLFPELKESEDGNIRKEIIAHIKWCEDSGYCSKEEMTRWITFLEKQGEQNTVVVIPKFRVGDVIRPKGSTAEYTIESISGECYHGKGWGLHISCDDDYELVKQNNAWSEEDENLFKCAIDAVKQESKVRTDGCLDEEVGEMVIDWLKSLKDRYTWKPSEYELKVLKLAAEKDGACLMGLYEDLKKLREE